MRQGLYNRRYFDIHPIAGLIGTIQKINCPRDSWSIIVSVTAGALDVWFGEFTGDVALIPHLHFGQANWPQEIPLPQGVETITYRLSGENVTQNIACIMLGGP